MPRTPLFQALRRHVALARRANLPGAPPVGELVEMAREARWTRRRFVQASTVAGLGLAAGCAGRRGSPAPPPPASGGAAQIAIVGGGIAGLNAAYRLRQQGVRAEVYEASSRTGGRMLTAHDLLAPGLSTELGGEFIDSGHDELRALVGEFGLELLDTAAESEQALVREAYHFAGAIHGEEAVIEAFRPVAARIAEDLDGIEDVVDFEHEGGAGRLDRTPLAEYLAGIGASGWLGKLLEVAYVTEYGLDAGEQSALNLLFLIGTETEDGFAVFGESDERYKVRGGNQRVVDELHRRVEDQVRLEHRLTALGRRGDGFVLSFEGAAGVAREATADIVLLALPFTLLREVDLRLELPAWKRRVIAELGYGTGAKVLVGFDRRIWRELGYTGAVFSDEPFQLAWDSSQLQPGTAGGLTLYSGGRPGVEVGTGSAGDQVARLLPGVEKVFPGAGAAVNGKTARFHWPSYRYTRGSYACYRPGQWTGIGGAEGRPVGRLLFAGEHTSTDFQGYMNGGADSGRAAAAAILGLLGRSAGETGARARPLVRPGRRAALAALFTGGAARAGVRAGERR